ncbi:16S rRNA (cytosine(967)-C(5))-methyltransferase RsmB [Aerococcaceae bacterium DSM 111176]|nr:16S rRNA (cytosine(967)-C(5))-methyltransferase RsmB [Aerococcaceae bacterium DSM 111176]
MKVKQRSKKQLSNNVRFQALLILDEIEHNQGYSNVLLNDFLKESPLSTLDNQLLVQMVYGVTQLRYRLDYYLNPFIKGKKIDDWIMTLLRLSVYQMTELDRVPEHAIINEAVKIAKTNGHQGLGNFVNALLRNIQRQGLPNTADIENQTDYLSTHYSIEPWIVDYLLEMVGEDKTISILESLIERPFVSARINGKPEDRAQIIEELEDEGYQVTEGVLSPYGIRVLSGNVVDSAAFIDGKITVQDESSMLVAPFGQPQPNQVALDACSAPGGKATHIAQMIPGGQLDALDISPAKLSKVSEHAERMQLEDIVSTHVADATTFQPEENKKYDVIYVDVPCSGLGLMRRKPEIKYEKNKADIEALKDIQLAILNNVSDLLKENGILIYSTCTITIEENEFLLQDFLKGQPDFINKPILSDEVSNPSIVTQEGHVRVWPDEFMTDGFFIARMEKKVK